MKHYLVILFLALATAASAEDVGTITISDAKYTTYYNSKQAYVMPVECLGYILYYKNGWNMYVAYVSGEPVPAGEPLIIMSNTQKTYVLKEPEQTDDVGGNNPLNQLLGTDEQTKLTDDKNYYFYGLTLNANNVPTSAGFYWMNETGSAFENGAHKCYLKVPKSRYQNNAKGFSFQELLDSDEDLIAALLAEQHPETMYDLSGRAVTGKPKSGLYISGGKKYIIK